jgi:hypothetical protein
MKASSASENWCSHLFELDREKRTLNLAREGGRARAREKSRSRTREVALALARAHARTSVLETLALSLFQSGAIKESD